MPLSNGVGHWPKSHYVAPPPQQPSGPAYIQSYDPNWKPRNQAPRPKHSERPSSPDRSPRDRQYNEPTQQRNSPPPRYYSERPEPPKPFRAKNYYGEPGHNRLGINRMEPSSQYGHSRYGLQYNADRTIMQPKGYNSVGPKGLESFESYGPRMNMASGSCGSGMRPLWAILGGLLVAGGIAGIIAGGVLGAKAANTPAAATNLLGPVKYYQINGLYAPCVDRLATKAPVVTKAPVTTKAATVKATTVGRTTTHCIPLTYTTSMTTTQAATTTQVATTVVTTQETTTDENTATATSPETTSANTATTVAPTTTKAPTTAAATTTRAQTTSICVWVTYTTAKTTAAVTTTTTTTTTPRPTTQTTLPYCDQLTTTYTIKTMQPLGLVSGGMATVIMNNGWYREVLLLAVLLVSFAVIRPR